MVPPGVHVGAQPAGVAVVVAPEVSFLTRFLFQLAVFSCMLLNTKIACQILIL